MTSLRSVRSVALVMALGCILLLSQACDDPAPASTPTPPPPTVSPSPTQIPPSPTPPPLSPPPTSIQILPSPTPTETALVPTATPVPAPLTPSPISDPRARGGTLNLSTKEAIPHQDVHIDVSPALAIWGPGIAYSRLLRLKSGPDIQLPSMELECDLCESWTLETPTSFIFNLRPNARWHDIDPVNGRPVESQDVVFSYTRQGNPDLPNAPLLHNVDSVRALEPKKLRVSFRSPDADALIPLAEGHSKIVTREAVELTGDLHNGPTIGSGPWILDQTSDGSHTFSQNPEYFEPGLPLVSNLNVMVLPDDSTQLAAFQTGLTDVIQMSPPTWSDHLARTPDALHLAIRQPGTGVEVAFRTTVPPFDDVRIRRAAMLAFDPLKAIEEHWGGFAFIGPGFPVAASDWLLPDADLVNRFGRPSDARKLLEDAGINAPIPVTITVGDFGEAYLRHAHAVSVELKSVGFVAEVDIVNRRDFGERVWLGGDYQLMLGPPAPVTVPNGYLLPILHSQGRWNTTGHSDQHLDELLEAQAVEMDPDRRAELVREIQRLALDNAYRFMPAAMVAIWAWNPRVKDFHPNFEAFEYHHWARVWLDR